MKPYLALTLLLCSCQSKEQMPMSHYFGIGLLVVVVIMAISFGNYLDKESEKARHKREEERLATEKMIAADNEWWRKFNEEEAEWLRRCAVISRLKANSNRRRYSRSTLTNTRF